MEKFITDERTGLCYELVGDYYLIAGEDEPEGRPIGVWGQRHLRYIRKHKVSLYAELLTTGKLNDYLCRENRWHDFRCQRNARRERKAYAGGACKGADCKRSNGFAGSGCCLIDFTHNSTLWRFFKKYLKTT